MSSSRSYVMLLYQIFKQKTRSLSSIQTDNDNVIICYFGD